MKLTVLLILFISSIHLANAQFAENNAIYSTVELNLGNYVGADLSLNYVYKETYSLKIGYTGNIRKPISQPSDFSSGFFGALFMGLINPYDQMENYQMAAGKIYKLNASGTIRVNLSLGIGYTIIREPENWEKTGGGFLGNNYSWDYDQYNTVSLIINPKVEFPFSRVYGLTISPMLQINKDRTYLGIGFGQMLGLLKKKKQKNNTKNQEN